MFLLFLYLLIDCLSIVFHFFFLIFLWFHVCRCFFFLLQNCFWSQVTFVFYITCTNKLMGEDVDRMT